MHPFVLSTISMYCTVHYTSLYPQLSPVQRSHMYMSIYASTNRMFVGRGCFGRESSHGISELCHEHKSGPFGPFCPVIVSDEVGWQPCPATPVAPSWWQGSWIFMSSILSKNINVDKDLVFHRWRPSRTRYCSLWIGFCRFGCHVHKLSSYGPDTFTHGY